MSSNAAIVSQQITSLLHTGKVAQTGFWMP